VKFQILVATFAATTTLGAMAAETYVLESSHSQPGFEATHLGLSTQRGAFGKLTGKVTLDRAAKTGAVDVTIDTASIRSFDPRLDNTLKGEKFFNVEKFPTMTFKSTSVAFDGDRVVGVTGDLTMIGVTKPVVLKIDNFKCGDNPFNKKPMCGGDATATIKRSEWGMTAGIPYAPSDEVKLLLPIEGYRE